VFIINNQSHLPATIYIKAKLRGSTSVLMAEVAALALASRVVSAIGIQSPFFLTDNQQLVSFFNENDLTTPHWEVKPFTQSFINHISSINVKIFKVPRKLNTTAHVLASQALNSPSSTPDRFLFSCLKKIQGRKKVLGYFLYMPRNTSQKTQYAQECLL
jgi:hypothetical protein